MNLPSDLHPYDYWLSRGRRVTGKAEYFAHFEDGSRPLPLFREDQTTEVRDDARTQWPQILTRAEHEALKPAKSTPKPRVWFKYSTPDQTWSIWVGAKKELGDRLKAGGYKVVRPGEWELATPRPKPLHQALGAIKSMLDDYNVGLKVDGQETPLPEVI